MNSQEFKAKLEEAREALVTAKRMATSRQDKIINLAYVIEKIEDYIFRVECRINNEEDEELEEV